MKLVLIKMLETTTGSSSGWGTDAAIYEAGSVYEVSPTLANIFLARGVCQKAKVTASFDAQDVPVEPDVSVAPDVPEPSDDAEGQKEPEAPAPNLEKTNAQVDIDITNVSEPEPAAKPKRKTRRKRQFKAEAE